jgi:uncharacterized protein (TIGR03083 family)
MSHDVLTPAGPANPIKTAHLFPGLGEKLLHLLRNLAPEQWDTPTACAPWAVRDVAAHLLDTDLRQLSILRDGAPLIQPVQPIESHADRVAFLDTLNHQWITATRRLSHTVLLDLLGHAGAQIAEFYARLDMQAQSRFGVGWAGEEQSANWFHVAREYTEKWHHQQHIRDAVNETGAQDEILDETFGAPALATFMRALPYTYREHSAPAGTAILVQIEGPAGGTWTLRRESNAWQLYTGKAEQPAAAIALDADQAWRLFTKGLPPSVVRGQSTLEGNEELAAPFFATVSILA